MQRLKIWRHAGSALGVEGLGLLLPLLLVLLLLGVVLVLVLLPVLFGYLLLGNVALVIEKERHQRQ